MKAAHHNTASLLQSMGSVGNMVELEEQTSKQNESSIFFSHTL